MYRSFLPLALLLAPPALAAPDLLPVHGNLRDAQGVPVDGPTEVTFRLYDEAGDIAFESARTVDVTQGNFTVYLGQDVPLDLELFAGSPTVSLGIQVGQDSEMAPIELGSVPYAAYARYAGDAGTVGGATLEQIQAEIPVVGDLDGRYLPSDYTPGWSDLTDIPTDLADGDDDTTYTAGTGLTLDATEFSVVEGDLRAMLDDDYMPFSYTPAWSTLTGVPGDLADGDDDTTYSAGTGLSLSGTTFAVDKSTVEGWARGVAYDTETELTALLDDNYRGASDAVAWSDLSGVPTGLADGDDDTTYSAGAGLTLSGTTFAVDKSTVEGWAKGVAYDTPAEIGTVLSGNALTLNQATKLGVNRLDSYENVRTIVTKSYADGVCGSHTAVHVPQRYMGQTGNDICKADGRGKRTCRSVKFVYVTNENARSTYSPNDLSCGSNVNHPWPWGASYTTPNSLSSEWGHGNTWVVCCS